MLKHAPSARPAQSPAPTAPSSPGGVLGLSERCWPLLASPLLRSGTAAAGWARPAAARCSLVTRTPEAQRREGCAHKPPRSTPWPTPRPGPAPRPPRLTLRPRLLQLSLAVVCEAKEAFQEHSPLPESRPWNRRSSARDSYWTPYPFLAS